MSGETPKPPNPARRALYANAVRSLVEIAVMASGGSSAGAVLVLAEAIRAIGVNGDLSGESDLPRRIVEAIAAVGREQQTERPS